MNFIKQKVFLLKSPRFKSMMMFMRALIQRVLQAKVGVDGQTTGEIQQGLLVFLGLGREDTLQKGQKLIDKK